MAETNSSSTTMRDLLNSVTDAEIIDAMKELYEAKYVPALEWFDKELRNLPEFKNTKNGSIIITESPQKDGSIYYYPSIKYKDDPEKYATDLMPWNELLSYTIDTSYIEKIGKNKLLAFFIHDITFYGWNNNHIESMPFP